MSDPAAPTQPDPPVLVKRGARWTHVCIESDGKDVSHLGYAGAKLQVGRHATINMTCIGGVGTEKEHRRRGLAKKVFRHMLQEAARDGHVAVGLFTSRRIVAHRLYRQFGLVDVLRQRPAVKILDHARLARRAFAAFARRSADLQSRRIDLTLKLDPSAPIHLRIEGNEVTVLSRAPRKVDLRLAMSDLTFLRLRQGEMGLEQARAARLLRYEGDSDVCRLLAKALPDRLATIEED
jgi:GNAT superfamily N-acetyltransferase